MRAARVSYRAEWVRCGKRTCRCARAGEKHGPYWYARWTTKNGLRRKCYLGKTRRRVTPAELAAPPTPVRLPRRDKPASASRARDS